MRKFLFICLFISTSVYSQDTYQRLFYAQDFNYYGVPLFYHGGFGYQKDDFRMIFPYVGNSFDPIEDYGVDIYTGIVFHYRDFTLDAKVKYQVGTWKESFGLDYVESLNLYGSFTLGYNFESIKLAVSLDVGDFLITNKTDTGALRGEKTVVLKPSIDISGVSYDDSVTRLGYTARFSFDIVPEYNIQTFHVSSYVPMNFHLAYGWIGLNLMPGIEYKGFINQNSSGYQFTSPTAPFRSLRFFSEDVANFQFLASLSTEFRFYLKFLDAISPSLSRLFLNFISTVGYASTFEQSIGHGNLIYVNGGGIGYYLFDSAAFMINVGADQRQEVFINLSIVSPLELSI